MDVETFALFATLEVVLLLGAAVFMLQRKITQLYKQLDEQPSSDAAPESFDSVKSGYLAYLEKEILGTHALLEQLRTDADVNHDQLNALQNRLLLLDAEKQVVESSNDYPKRHWEFVLEHFKPVSPTPEAEQSVPEPMLHETGDTDQVASLKDTLQQQGDVIESMQELLQQIKQDPQAGLVEQLEQQLHQLERRYQEANTCIEIMGQENERLQEKIDHRDYRIGQAEAEKNESVADLEMQLGKQKRNITELHDLVGDLQLGAGKAEQLQGKLDQFDLASRDMDMCIQVLEEENRFLQEQIATLLKADEGESVYGRAAGQNDHADLQKEVDVLRAELAEKEQKISDVEEKYASIEQEYLTLYEEANS